LNYLRTYLELEMVKYEGKFTYRFDVMTGLDTSACFLPPMILQPYVENSIQHGVRAGVAAGLVTVAMYIRDEWLLCTVEDNGIGRKAAAEGKRKDNGHQSRGMALTAERLSIWSRQAQADIRVEVQDLYTQAGEAAGTRVTVFIPLKEANNPF
jgi:LytS/YehU family sensor histidine kinase